LAYFLALKREAIYSSEIAINFYHSMASYPRRQYSSKAEEI
jgi:hypothetical protein